MLTRGIHVANPGYHARSKWPVPGPPWRSPTPRDLNTTLLKRSQFSRASQRRNSEFGDSVPGGAHEPGESIVDYLDATDDVFFITAGKARVTIYSHAGKVVSFGELGPGEVFGAYPAVDHCPRSASVQARTSCLVASMPASAFRARLQSELAVLTQLVRRTRSVARRVYELSTIHVNTRIQAELLRLASSRPQEGELETSGGYVRAHRASTHTC
jgi:CRP-like cAMP-binding protein